MLDTGNNIVERTMSLLGGVTVTIRGSSQNWAYPNIHGDVMAVTDANGVLQGELHFYDPYGTPLDGSPDTAAGSFESGWLGQHQRPLERVGGLATIEMGARQYVPLLGRFLQVDPIEGGSCNDYDYVCGDPVNELDLDGHAMSRRNNQSLCYRYRALRGNVARGVYFGFTAAQICRLRSLVKAGALSRRGLNWGTDSCSTVGGKAMNGAFLGSFGNACGKHDFGYRNHSGIFGRTNESDRKQVDNQFRRDMQDVCTQFGIVITGRTGACCGAAETMYRAVRTFGRSAYD